MEESFFEILGECDNDSNIKSNFDYYSDDEIDNYWAHYYDENTEQELEF